MSKPRAGARWTPLQGLTSPLHLGCPDSVCPRMLCLERETEVVMEYWEG